MKIAVAQFEPRDGDKKYNLAVIEKLIEKAKSENADLVSFHEMSISAYTHTKDLSLSELTELAENVPEGQSTSELSMKAHWLRSFEKFIPLSVNICLLEMNM
jgi:predicted amidohydrolase